MYPLEMYIYQVDRKNICGHIKTQLKYINMICSFSEKTQLSESMSRESGGFIDLAASTVKGILGPFADRMRNLSPEKQQLHSMYVTCGTLIIKAL